MVNKKWVLITLCGWLLLTIVGSTRSVEYNQTILVWIALRQTWLLFGGWIAISKVGLLSWKSRDVVFGGVAGIGLFFLNGFVGYAVIQGLSRLYGVGVVNQWLIQERAGVDLLLSLADGNYLWAVFFLVVIGAPVSEELFFRGAVLSGLRSILPDWLGITIAALFFAWVHFYIIQFLPIFLAGIVLGVLFIRSQTIIRPIVAHIVVNGIVFLVYFFSM